MTDRLDLIGLRMVASIGLLPEERERRQPIEIDVRLDFAEPAGLDDELDGTVDYGAVCDRISDLVGRGHVDLLERLAALLATDLTEHPAVGAARVTVTKLRPPVPHDLAAASVTVER